SSHVADLGEVRTGGDVLGEGHAVEAGADLGGGDSTRAPRNVARDVDDGPQRDGGRARGPLGTLGARRSGVALRALRTGRALRALQTGVALRALQTGVALRALRPLGTNVTLDALRALRTDGTLGPLRTDIALRTLRANCTLRALGTGVALRA